MGRGGEEKVGIGHKREEQHKTRSEGKRTIHIVQWGWVDPRGRDYCTRVNALASRDQAGAGG